MARPPVAINRVHGTVDHIKPFFPRLREPDIPGLGRLSTYGIPVSFRLFGFNNSLVRVVWPLPGRAPSPGKAIESDSWEDARAEIERLSGPEAAQSVKKLLGQSGFVCYPILRPGEGPKTLGILSFVLSHKVSALMLVLDPPGQPLGQTPPGVRQELPKAAVESQGALGLWLEEMDLSRAAGVVMDSIPAPIRTSAKFIRTLWGLQNGYLMKKVLQFQVGVPTKILEETRANFGELWTTQRLVTVEESQSKLRVNLALGGIVDLGALVVSQSVMRTLKIESLTTWARTVTEKALEREFLSKTCDVFSHWSCPHRAFRLTGLKEVASFIDPPSPNSVPVVTIWDFSSVRTAIESRARGTDPVFYDPQGDRGLIMLRGCDMADARKVVSRKFERDGILVGDIVPVKEVSIR